MQNMIIIYEYCTIYIATAFLSSSFYYNFQNKTPFFTVTINSFCLDVFVVRTRLGKT